MASSSSLNRVVEGGSPPKVKCVSVARPPASYRWYSSATNISIGSTEYLVPPNAMYRNTSDIICEAYNTYGVSTFKFHFDVLCEWLFENALYLKRSRYFQQGCFSFFFFFSDKPNCTIRVVNNADDAKTLYCECEANPSQMNYTWFTYNEQEKSNGSVESTEAQYSPNSPSDDETYQCYAKNEIGYSEIQKVKLRGKFKLLCRK